MGNTGRRNGKWLFIGLFMVCLMIAALSVPDKAQAKTQTKRNKMDFQAKVISSGKVKLTWKKKIKNVKAVITREELSSGEKKTVRVNAYQGKYTDQTVFGNKYAYSMKITKKTGKQTTVYKDVVQEVYIGLSGVEFYVANDFEYDKYRPTVTKDYQVQIGGHRKEGGVTPAGYLFYRSDDNLEYKKIGESKSLSFLDKDVKLGEKYFYKIQSYYSYEGKRIYSAMSDYAMVHVANRKPVIDISIVSKDQETGEVLVKAHSDSKNPDIVICVEEYEVPIVDTQNGKRTVMKYEIEAGSTDGQKTWYPLGHTFFEPGTDLYVLLKATGKKWSEPEYTLPTFVLQTGYVSIFDYYETTCERYRSFYIYPTGSSYFKLSEEYDSYEDETP